MDMNTAPRNSTFFFGSETSSVYSDDDLISETNSTGTQIHHKSVLRPTLGGIPRDYGQNFERSSTLSFPYENTPQDLDEVDIPDLSASQNRNAFYRFESAEEAQERHQAEAARAQVDENVRARHVLGSEGHIMSNGPDMLSYSRSVHSPHGSQINSTGVYAEEDVRGRTMSAEPSPMLPLMDAEEIANEYISEISSSTPSLQGEYPAHDLIVEATQPQIPRPRAISISRDPTELDLTDLSALNRQDHHDEALQALSSGTPNIVGSEDLAILPHSGIQASDETMNANRRQGKVDWREGLTNGSPPRASLFSSTGREYGRSNSARGYDSGEFITNLEDSAPATKKSRKRGVIKRLFCVP
ncbi:hypothetical protein N0V83_005440 [Neocucurbitaria cava]|uniref:Uncharacterized protein n=1 Tax=Neocucurbitaria cava TaxID=798079 RepID=A0A9W8Y9Q8_9PLEO|nr:hypothetical protein N0V83_005440 [Neocucurbitaria cava]